MRGQRLRNISIASCRLILILAVTGMKTGCTEKDSDVQPIEPIITGSWIEYSPYKWEHDGKPYHSVYCTVFSDGASDEIKELAGKFTDSKFIEILQMFNFYNLDELIFPTDREKIDVYINRYHVENIAAAYWGSIFITVRTSVLDTAFYNYLFKHEITHVIEFLIEGTVNFAADMWFTEAIAVYVGGGLNRINDVEDLDEWITRNAIYPNKGNPITIHRWEDYPEGSDKTGYYCVYEVIMEYLLDSNGLNKSLNDVLNVFYDLREGILFEESFENNFGISVELLEEEIFDRLREFLSDST